MLLDFTIVRKLVMIKGLGVLLHQIIVSKNDELLTYIGNYCVATQFNSIKNKAIIRLVAQKIYAPVVNWLHQEIVTKIAFLNCEKNFADAC